ncbi:ion channel [Lactobacillus hamsteri]|uniref:Ion transport domain-containing protein n=1 Tax=Lactobacillus hamsteri DSM 5661 = JCM 6256 TaxID=1423754 RepID=A0A0R1YG36_9LACO|nr:ion transporter [Lactobacillus hamsteri]KRM40933.1 hypothetical protein FC39_GL001577 [Lactobacillus hamsteri DSM 5661 = JCM 6256]
MDTTLKKNIYKWTMAILAIIAIVLIVMDFAAVIDINGRYSRWFWVNNIILIIFAIDYFVRLYKSDDKRLFVKNNIYDLLAIIPVGIAFNWMEMAQMGNIVLYFRLLRLIRLAGLVGKLRKILHTNGILYMIYFSIAFLMLGSVAISITEHVSLDRAFWWAITTASTVGYGDISTYTISPKTLMGKFVILVMILIGVGIMGMVTSSLTTYFMKKNSAINTSQNQSNMQLILKKLDNLEKQNQDLADANKKMQAQIEELRKEQNSTEWRRLKGWISKKKSEDENGK